MASVMGERIGSGSLALSSGSKGLRVLKSNKPEPWRAFNESDENKGNRGAELTAPQSLGISSAIAGVNFI
jgi:hypothetical protein